MTHRWLIALIIAILPATAFAELRPVGNVVSTSRTAAAIDFTLQNGVMARVEVIADDIVRVRVAPAGGLTTRQSGAVVPYSGPAPSVSIFDIADAAYVLTTQLTVVVLKQPFRVVVLRSDGALVQADLDPAVVWDPASGAVIGRKWAPPDEAYFGAGGRGGAINRRGRTFTMRNVDWAGYDANSDPLYVSIPFYMALRQGTAHGIFLDNPAQPYLDFDSTGTGTLMFGAAAGELDYYVFAGGTPGDVTREYAAITGMPHLPPKWSLGYHQSRYGYASADEILAVAATLRQLNIPADAIHFDIDYMDRFQLFTWNPNTFGDPLWMNGLLHYLGFHTVNIMEPLIKTDDRLWPYFDALGHFVKKPDGTSYINSIWLGEVSWVDFTKPAAARTYIDILKSFLSTGIDGVWADLNEPAQNYMPDAVYDSAGQPRFDFEARNIFALHEAASIYLAQAEMRPGTRPWILSRSGYSGIQRFAANWGGDQLATWDSLRVSVEMTQSMSLSGQNQYGHDIGGFIGSPSPELFIRWLEAGSYTTFFRNHAINSSERREPWVFGEPYLGMARTIIEQRYRLMPYLYSLMALASNRAEPALAPMFFHFPGDPATYGQDDAFMLGPSLLVAPVVEQGAVSRMVYLPAGAEWFDATGVRYLGGFAATVAAPLGATPVFIRAGAIVPQGPVMQYADAQPLKEVALQLYPGPDSGFLLYEDDGVSTDNTRGAYLATLIERTGDGGSITTRITRVSGEWPPPADRSWTLHAHAFIGTPVAVLVNSAGVPEAASESALASMAAGWFKRPDNTVLVRVPDSVSPILVEIQK